MKKTLLTIALLAFSASVLMAENNVLGIFNVGIKAGIVSSSEKVPTSGQEIRDAAFADGTGWFAAALVRVNIPKLPLFIQPELQYTTNKYKIPTTEGSTETEEEKVKLVDMPILAGVEAGLGRLIRLRVNAGPVFAISSGKSLAELKSEDFKKVYKDPSLTWTAGVGISVLSIMIDMRYNGNFKNGKVDTNDVAGSVDTQRTSWNLSVGIMF